MKDHIFELPNGRPIYCDRPDKIHAEQAIQDFYKAFSPILNGQEAWAMDIGTSCGDSTIVMGACLAPSDNSRVIAIEPSREIYPLLAQNLAKNSWMRWDVHHVGASDAFQMVDFVYGIDNGGVLDATIVPERGPCKPSYQIQLVHTYEYLRTAYTLEELDRIKFIKIDTEGWDFKVLSGLAPLLYRNRIPVMVEWWNDPKNSNLMFAVIDKLYYQAFNSNGELVTRFDFNSPKRTQDLILKPIP